MNIFYLHNSFFIVIYQLTAAVVAGRIMRCKIQSTKKKKKHRNKILRNIHARKGKNSIRHFDYERNTKRIVKLIFFITTECIKRIILHDRYFTSGEIIYTNQHGGHNINRTYRKTRIVAKIQNITFARADHYPNSPPPRLHFAVTLKTIIIFLCIISRSNRKRKKKKY